MYLSHFGLNEEPFSIVPNPQFLYLSERHKEAIAHIKSGIAAGGGFAMLTGEVGTGKTLVCKSVLEELSEHTQVALIVNPKLSEHDLLLSICEQFSCPIDVNRPLVEQLKQHLTELFEGGTQPLLVVDEAHHLSVLALEQLRLLTNFEIGPHKLLKVWLIGQPELQQRLQTAELRQLAQRITGRYHLLALQPHEVEAYIQHRLTKAGANQSILMAAQTKQIAKAAQVPRLINLIADKSLQLAYMAGATHVSKHYVAEAIESVMLHQYQHPPTTGHKWPLKAVTAAIVAACAVTAWWWYQPSNTMQPTGVSASQSDVTAPQLPTEPVEPVATILSENDQTKSQDIVPEVPVSQESLGESLDVVNNAQTTVVTQVTTPDWLVDVDPRFNSEIIAMQRLFQLWGYQASIMASSCSQVPLPFRCVVNQGSWEQVVQTQRPVILALRHDEQLKYGVVYAIHNDAVDILFDEARLRVKTQWIERYWDGDYIELWYSALQAPLKQGQQSDQIQVLEDQLSLALSEPTRLNDRFDSILANKVKAFQLWKGLDVDGVVGNQTLKALDKASNSAAPSTRVPPVDADIMIEDKALKLMLPTIASLASLSVSEAQSAEQFDASERVTRQPVVIPTQPDGSEHFDFKELNLDELDPDIARMVANAIENTPEVNSEASPSVLSSRRVKIESADPQLTERLPTMNFQTHMYASDPQKRWVKVNGKELQQGEWLDQEVKVVEIAPRYVVMEFDGQQIEFPALFEWQ
ncbi:AAA family ATPase [Vibrio sp. qd031]|uniref:AAA family ATPase n=1 Tax=Vibrio sp. qd031 TaxID=1603038 RepID=UPI000A114F71|nr:AAA family ATPase [Vibrio sp. qd031]